MLDPKLLELIREMRAGLDNVTKGQWTLVDNEILVEDRYTLCDFDGSVLSGDEDEANSRHLVRCSPENIAKLLDAAESALQQPGGWQPIETAPFWTIVDLWCINGCEESAAYSTGKVIGELVPRRHKTEEYGWFGNQSKDGIPQGKYPDLIPVAWRETIPDCPAHFIAPHLATPPHSGSSGQTTGDGK